MNTNTRKHVIVSLCFSLYTSEIMVNIVTIIVQTCFFLKGSLVVQEMFYQLFFIVIKIYIIGL
jgi:hypothetical protein